jgi:small subunit ribosomal protein S3
VGQKVHPLGFRLRITQNHRSSWFADQKTYPSILEEDYKIRAYIKREFSSAGISKIEIERRSEQVELHIHTSRPGIIVGRSGSCIDKIKEDLQKVL